MSLLLRRLYRVPFRYGLICTGHRRRIKTEEEAKVVAAVWGTELIKFIAALAFFTRMI